MRIKTGRCAAVLACVIALMLIAGGNVRAATEISTWEDLHNVRNNLDGSYILMNDLGPGDADYGDYNDGPGWDPIGGGGTPFMGTFDGNRKKITGLYINRPSEIVGLFGNVGVGARIDNVVLENISIWGVRYVGGLAGYNEGIIAKSYAAGEVEAERGHAGGLAGINTGHIWESFSRGGVSAITMAGGLVGSNFNGIIHNSYSTSDVSSSEDRAGVAGIAGGIVGDNQGSITECYSTGRVQSANDWPPAGGLVGINTGPVVNSFWDRESSGAGESDGGEGKTTREMMTKSTFTDAEWNFNSIWIINDGESYPMLRWQMGIAPIPVPDVPLPVPTPDDPDIPTIPDLRPQPPEDLRASPGDREVMLTWDESPSQGVEGYRVYVRVPESLFRFQASVPADMTEYRHHGLTNNVTYIYTVRSLRYGLESAEASNTARAVPGTDESGEDAPPSPDEMPPPEGEVQDEEKQDEEDSSGCFIATAAYGSPMSSEVICLRAFRDGFLLGSGAGNGLVRAYYAASPALAEVIEGRTVLTFIARLHLAPFVKAAGWMFN